MEGDERQFEEKAVSVDASAEVTRTGQCHSLSELPFFQKTRDVLLCPLPFLSAFYGRKRTLKKCGLLPKVSPVALVSELSGCEPGTRWR